MQAGIVPGLCLAALFASCAAREPQAPPPALELRISDARTDARAGEILVFDAVFRNPGPAPLSVYLPQDGSTDGRVPPSFEFEVLQLPYLGPVPGLTGSCGNCGGEYTDRTRVVVPAGGEATMRVAAPVFPSEAGRYRVRLRYEVRAGDYPGPFLHIPSEEEPRRGDWPAGVFVGAVRSEPVEISCGARR